MKKRISILLLLIVILQMLVPTLMGVPKVFATPQIDDWGTTVGDKWSFGGVKYKVIANIQDTDKYYGGDGWNDYALEVISTTVSNNGSTIFIRDFLNDEGEFDNGYGTVYEFYHDYIVVGIADNAFKDSDKIKRVVFVDDCTDEDKIQTFNHLSYIGEGAFSGCKNLETIAYKTGLDKYSEKNIPYNISRIGENAFAGCTSLKSINIGGGLTVVQKNMFKNCSALTDVTYYEEKIVEIEEYAFYGCESLTSVNLGSNVTSLGKYAFAYCYNLKSFSCKVKNIPQWAFAMCESMTYFSSGGNMETVGEAGFLRCKGLAFNDLSDITSIGESAFNTCEAIKSIKLGSGLTTIPKQAFLNCSNLNSVTIPNSVQSIGEEAFKNTALTSITLPNTVTEIGKSAFANCTKMTKATISNQLETLPDELFYKCTSLNSVGNLNNNNTSLKNIGSKVFSYASLTKLDIPSSVMTIGESAFGNCMKLSEITFNSTNITFTQDPCKNTTQTITVKLYIGNNYTYNHLKLLKDNGTRPNFKFQSLSGVPTPQIEATANVGKVKVEVNSQYGMLEEISCVLIGDDDIFEDVPNETSFTKNYSFDITALGSIQARIVVKYNNGEQVTKMVTLTENANVIVVTPTVEYDDWLGNGGQHAKVTLNVSGATSGAEYEYRFGKANGGFTNWSTTNFNYYQNTGKFYGQARPVGSTMESDIRRCSYNIDASQIIVPSITVPEPEEPEQGLPEPSEPDEPEPGEPDGDEPDGGEPDGDEPVYPSDYITFITRTGSGLALNNNKEVKSDILYLGNSNSPDTVFKCNINNKKNGNEYVWENWDNISNDGVNNRRNVTEDINYLRICVEGDEEHAKAFSLSINIYQDYEADDTLNPSDYITQITRLESRLNITSDEKVKSDVLYILAALEDNTVFKCNINNKKNGSSFVWENWDNIPNDGSTLKRNVTEDIHSLRVCVEGDEANAREFPICINVDNDAPIINYVIQTNENKDKAYVTITAHDNEVGLDKGYINLNIERDNGPVLISCTQTNGEWVPNINDSEYNLDVNRSEDTILITFELTANEYVGFQIGDNFNNINNQSIRINSIDEVKPTIQKVTGGKYSNDIEWVYSTQGVTISVSAYDKVGNKNETEGLQYSFDGGKTWQTATSKVFTTKTDGIKVCVKDKAGNIAEYSKTLRIPNIDVTFPEIHVLEVIKINEGEDGWTKGAKLRIEAKDSETGIDSDIGVYGSFGIEAQYTTKSTHINGNEYEIKVTKEAEGQNEAIIHARNNLGVTADYVYREFKNVKIDSTAPTVTVSGNPTSPVNNSVTLTIDAEDALSGLAEKPYSFDNGKTWQSENTKTYDDNTTVYVKVKDKAGNITSKTEKITSIRKFDHLEVTTPPDLTNYVDGQHFNPEGMVVTAIYTAGDNKVLSEEEYEIINGEDLNIEQESITIQHTGEAFNGVTETKTVEQPITVEQLTLSNISVQTMPNKTKYIEGQKFDPTGMKIVAFYNNQFATIDEEDYEIVNGERLGCGQKTVTIRYTDTLLDGKEVTCETTVPITVEEKVLTRIRVKVAPKRTTYVEGENFNTEEMVVIATFNDGEEREITDYTVTDGYNLGVGKENVEISYTYIGTEFNYTKTTTQKITVLKKELTSIAIKTPANKTSYIASEDFAQKGMEVIAWFNDLVVEKLEANEYQIVDGEYLKVDQKDVTISYTFDGVTRTIKHPINVVDRKLVSIKITTPPNKTNYIEGQNFDPEGMVVKAVYDSRKEEEITNYEIKSGDVLKTGQTYVTISYEEAGVTKTTSQRINVEQLKLTGIQIITSPDKTEYVEGQDFDPSGMIVRVWYNNTIVQTIVDYVLEGNKNLAVGEKEVIVSYTEDGITVSAVQKIRVIEKRLNEIKITREPDKIDYIEGQNFETRGLIVEAIYNDGTSKEITEYEVRDGNKLSANKEAVTIRYTENGRTVSTTQRISVVEKVITKLEIVQEPIKTKYVEGQNFDSEGMVVLVTYNDGETKEITRYKVENGKELAPGNVDIEITYTEDNVTLKTLQRIEVEAKVLTGIVITTAPSKIQYVEGQNFEKSGMVVTAVFNDGSENVVDDYEILDGNNLKAGKTVVTMRYVKDSKTAIATQAIEVAEKVITSISVTTAPNKVNYLEGETFEKDGMVVTATYNDGETKEITNYTISNGENLTLEQRSVTISYTEEKVTKTVEQNITVQEKLVVNINKYEEVIGEEESYIQHITPNTTIAEILEEIATNGTVTIYDGTTEITNQDEKVGTGMEVVITLNKETIRYTTVVIGDLNGDGEMGDADVLIMARYMVSLEENVEDPYLKAADVKQDGHYATDTDLLKMVRILVGLSTL